MAALGQECLRRVRRLRAEKVIVADVSLLDPLAVGKARRTAFAVCGFVCDSVGKAA
jgi:DNA-binding Lrp family transcriptional regulator